MRNEAMYYRTYDGLMYIDFQFYNLGFMRGWRIYICSDIDYQYRDSSFQATHRMRGASDMDPYICWRGKIRTFAEAKAVAGLWGDVTSLYINNGNGESFDAIARQLSKNR